MQIQSVTHLEKCTFMVVDFTKYISLVEFLIFRLNCLKSLLKFQLMDEMRIALERGSYLGQLGSLLISLSWPLRGLLAEKQGE